MAQNICNICGANYEYKNGKWVCPACGAYKPEELSNEEVTLLYNASQKIRLALFDDAEEQYKDIVSKYPNNPDGYWGLVLAKYGIKYEQDYDGKMIPSCYAASYESVLTDKNYLKAIELADKGNRKYYEEQASKIEKIRKEWIEKASKEEPYDIFISYKDTEKENGTERTKDSYDALELYTMLTKLGYRVFYSRESLKDKAGEKYEPYIFNALNTAHTMIVYGSKPEYIESTWIKNEWMRFYKRIKLGKKQPNALLVVYNGFNPAELPSPLSKMQNLDRSRIDFSREIESYCKKVIKAATTVLPKIERVEIKAKKGKVGQIVKIQAIELKNNSAPKAEIVREEVKKREIGNYTVSKLTANAENELKVAYAQLASTNFNEAKNAFNTFLVKNPKNGHALTGKLLAENKNKDLDEFSSVGVKTFADWKLLEQVLLFSEKTVSEKILKALCEETVNSFNSGNLQRARDIYAQISSYEDNNVTEMRKAVCDLAKGIIGKDNESAKYFIDGYLIYEQNEVLFLEQIKQTVNVSIEKGDFGFAKEYVSEWLKYESDDFSANLATLKIKYQVKTLAEVFNKIESKNNYAEIDDILHKLNEESAGQCFKNVCERVNALLTADNFGKEAYSYIDRFFRYNFAERSNYISNFLNLVANKATDNSAKIFDLLLSLSSYETEDYIDYTLKFADNALKNGNFDLADKYYDKINELHETALSWEGKLKCHLKAKNETEYSANVKNLIKFSFIDNILSLLENDDKRAAFIIRLIGYVYSTIKTTKNETDKCVKVFENLLAYMPKDYDGKLIEWLFKFARFLKSNGNFDLAEKLYATIVNYDAENHVAYWEMLQAKLNCKDENAIIHQQSLISEFQEFQNALLASANNDAALKHYIEIQNKQKAWVEKEKQRQISAKKRKKFIKIVSIVLAVVIIITAGIFGGVTYYNSESVLKYDATDSGLSVYSGKYYKADETLIIPYKVDNESVTEIKAEAFKNHTEIKKVVIPTAVTKIGDGAFEGCVNLENVEIKDVAENSSYNSSASINSTGISLYSVKNYTTTINATSKLIVIGSRAFKGCTKLNDFTLNYGLKTIGEEAFSGTGLKEITIPETVEFVGKAAFENCNDLVNIEVGDRDEIPQDWDENWNKGQETKVEFAVRVIFNYNGADEVIKSEQYVVYDKTYSFPVPVKEGYTFIGWHRGEAKLTDNNGTSLNAWNYQDGGTVKAEFTANENTVFFNGNGATSGETESLKIHTAESANLNSNGFIKEGYTFKGWATSVNGTKVYNDNALYTMGKNSSYVLYAVWQANTNVLHFNANGGSGTMTDKNINTDSTATLSANTFTRDGYTFAGWATSANGAKVYNDKANYTMGTNEEYTLYALWTIVSYSINYNLNEGVLAFDNPTTYNIETDTFTLNNPSRNGYTFVGWSGTEIIDSSLTVTIVNGSIGSRSYTANWQANLNTLHFNANGGTGEMADMKIATDSTEMLFENAFTQDGYHFIGWANSSNGSIVYCNGSSYTMGAEQSYTIYAIWEKNTNYIVFNSNGGKGTMDNQSALTNTMVVLSKCAFTALDGYVFAGWSEDPNGSADYLDCTSFSVGTNNIYNLYAIWNKMPATASEYFNFSLQDDDTYAIVSVSSDIPSKVIIPETYNEKTVTKIDDSAFEDCSTIQEITIYENITSIGDKAFYNCLNLEKINLGLNSQLKTIGENSFRNCAKLIEINLSNTITDLGTGVFYNCSGLKNIIMPKNIKIIRDYTFANCSALKTIIIFEDVEEIQFSAFAGCSGLEKVFYFSNSDMWGDISIAGSNNQMTGAERFYYSEEEPTTSGNYWHYVNEEPIVWEMPEYSVSLYLNGGTVKEAQIPSNALLYNGHYYYIYNIDKTWKEAKEYCESLGGHLATVTDSAEDSFLKNNLGSDWYWLGGYIEDGDWKWITGEEWQYTNWNTGEPTGLYNGVVEDGLQYAKQQKWNDGPKESAEYFICEWEITPTVINGNTIKYTVETETFSLPVIQKNGYEFIGWTWVGNSVPQKYVLIEKGSYGDKTYTANYQSTGSTQSNSQEETLYKRVNSNGTADENGTYILFGEYPQTIKANNVTITNTTDSRGYYLGSDGSYYAAITANPYENTYKFSNGSSITKGVVYYFKVEPIKWRILEEGDGTATLLCEMIIDAQKYDDSSNNYANSNIRAWLNDNFYNTAFNGLQRLIINSVEVDNSARSTNPNNNSTYWNSGKNSYASSNTNDKVWLLSMQDVTKSSYGFNSSYSSTDSSRQKVTSDYARANYAWNNAPNYINGYWWVRSPYYNSSNIAWYVNCLGYNNNDYYGYVYNNFGGVVPAIKISLNGTINIEPENDQSLYNRVNGSGTTDENGNYILFGEYPQTIKADNVTVYNITDNRGYYLGSDGEYYAKVIANKYNNSYLTDSSDSKFTNGSSIIDGAVYYFKVEPIKWRILEEKDGTVTLLCEMIIDAQKYDNSSNNYANSDIRAWLNDNFYNTAFNDLQKALLNTVEVDNSARSTNPNNNSTYWNSGKNNYACSNTNDKVWLLSLQDVTKTSYGFNSSMSNEDTFRAKFTTDFARANSAFIETRSGYEGNCWWWLRSPTYDSSNKVSDCGTVGNVVRSVLYVDTKVGVAPVIKISLNGIVETTTLYKRVNTNGIEDESGDYILFGEYPQSEITDSGLKTILNTLAGTLPTNGNNNGWTSYEYYISDSNSTDFMWYKDLSYNGEKYRGVYFTQYRSRTTIGSNSDTYQDDNGYSPNSIYWFKWEPVKWQIITTQDGQALLLSELVIDSQNFYLNYNQRTINGNTVYANNYEYSDIRNWLNEVFYSSAFNNAQQGIIQTTLIDNSAKTTNPNNNSKYWNNGTNNYSCGNTNDAIFLFSVSDLTNETYGYSNNVETKDDFRIKQASDYAKIQGCGEWENGASNWWTRSSVYSSSHYIRVCAADGSVGEYMYNGVYDTQNGIVPALWIKLISQSNTNQNATSTDCFNFNLLSDDTYEIVSVDKNTLPSEVVIPETYNGKTITKISDNVFQNCSNITSILLPNSITSIGSYAFQDCTSLISITIPYGVTTLKRDTFAGCESLRTVIIPDSVTVLERGVFFNNFALENIVMSRNIGSMGTYVFSHCTSLTEVVIPKVLTSIGNTSFYDCGNLTKVYYLGTASDWSKISISYENDELKNATRYYYSDNYPENFVENTYWHYVNGEPTVWIENLSNNSLYTRINIDGIEADNGNYILFGEYPQTIKADNVTITNTTDNRGYYLGSDGAYYAKVTANPYKSGYTFTNGNTIICGTAYYFKVEPIKWRILNESNGTATLLCEMIIDSHRYDDNSNNYANSEIRAWLNDNFYNTAFNSLQKELINTIEIDNSANSTMPDNEVWNNGINNYACNNTNDKVSLLSMQEVTLTIYGFDSDYGSYDTMRRKETTDYARANFVWYSTADYEYCGWWLLRSPIYSGNYYKDVSHCGYVVASREVDIDYGGIVPTIQISL